MPYTADPGMIVGHAHLKVSDLERSIAFYRYVLGFDLMQRYGTQAAFMSAGAVRLDLGQRGVERGGTRRAHHRSRRPRRQRSGLFR